MTRSALETCRLEACRLNQALPRHNLVVMHSGNGSVFDAESGHVFIKPSGMDYELLTPRKIVEVDLESGQVVNGELRPSVDLPHHLFLYRNLPEVRSIIHTHSNHATAFAACLKPIPLCLTAIADEFGDEIPCTPYVGNEGDAIGRAILAHRTRAPAVLLGNHGVFAWGPTPQAALKAAVMVEDTARTVLLAMQLGQPVAIPADEAAKWHDRYWNRYGQTTTVETGGSQVAPPPHLLPLKRVAKSAAETELQVRQAAG
jgi:L-ribulose-5-phosphate 4-epimerase